MFEWLCVVVRGGLTMLSGVMVMCVVVYLVAVVLRVFLKVYLLPHNVLP